jgi:hypothetical protein
VISSLENFVWFKNKKNIYLKALPLDVMMQCFINGKICKFSHLPRKNHYNNMAGTSENITELPAHKSV